MHAHVSTFSAPKRGASIAEYEDAKFVGSDGKAEGEISQWPLRAIIADGATESLLAGRWARHLVTTFGSSCADITTADGFSTAYGDSVAGWTQELHQYKEERARRDSPIQWYEEPKLARGAHSTLLAVELRDGAEGRSPVWAAAAVGDACVFHVREEQLLRSFPMARAEDFSNQTALLNSHGTPQTALRRHLATDARDWQAEDQFYLATDALAAWCLQTTAEGGRPWEVLRDLDTADANGSFSDLVDGLRADRALRDDDTTLIRIDTWWTP